VVTPHGALFLPVHSVGEGPPRRRLACLQAWGDPRFAGWAPQPCFEPDACPDRDANRL